MLISVSLVNFNVLDFDWGDDENVFLMKDRNQFCVSSIPRMDDVEAVECTEESCDSEITRDASLILAQ